jgi:crotonobetaine/carnitine-CoA ligase
VAPSGSLWETIADRAQATPDDVLIVEAEGRSYSYAEVQATSLRWAAGLARAGPVGSGRVAVILPNQGALYLLRLACGQAGLVFAAINPLLRGKSLADALRRSSITDMVVSPETAPAVADVRAELATPVRIHLLDGERLHVADGPATPRPGDPAPTADEPAPMPHGVLQLPDPEHTHTIVYTSGTSGPAKPVRLTASVLQLYARTLFDDAGRPWTAGAGYYNPWHPAHILGAVALDAAVTRGLVLVLRRKFHQEKLWADVRRHDCRLAVLISVAAEVWAGRHPDQADNPLEVVGMSPLIDSIRDFERCFGVEAVSIYGMTEIGTVLTAHSPASSRTTGRPVPGYECRLESVPGIEPGPDPFGGRLGELVVRPMTTTSEYESAGGPAASGWSDGWFHTGDLFTETAGTYSFVGRIKDSIRRHGRNISAVDVEEEVRGIDQVSDCVCVGVPAPGPTGRAGDDEDIRLFVVPQAGGTIDPATLAEHLAGRLPPFMLPRYFDVIDELPRTLNGKLSRQALRQLPIGPRTYDRKQLLDSPVG